MQLSHSYSSIQLCCVLALATHSTVSASIWPAVGMGMCKILAQLLQQARVLQMHPAADTWISCLGCPRYTHCLPLPATCCRWDRSASNSLYPDWVRLEPISHWGRGWWKGASCESWRLDRKSHCDGLARLWQGFRVALFFPSELAFLSSNPQSNGLYSDHIARAGGADCSKWCWGGEVTAFQPSPATHSHKKFPDKMLVILNIPTS